MEDVKKSNRGLVVFLVVLVLLLLGGLGFGAYKYMELDKDYNKLIDDNKTMSEELNTTKDSLEKTNIDANSLKEGYIKFGKDYKIYSLEQHNSATYSMVVGYNGNLYSIVAGQYGTMCISKISEAKFNSSNDYECKIDSDVDSYIHKFKGKESDLSKVAFSISYNSTDGAKYPILIYKSGEIETNNEETTKALKDYKIKDFVSEECKELNGMECKKGKIEYKVVLQDGTEKIINK